MTAADSKTGLQAPSAPLGGRYRPHARYKDSGVGWLGKIPEHWNPIRLRFVAQQRIGKLDAKPRDATFVGLEHVESWTGRLAIQAQPETVDSVVSVFRRGDVLFGKLRPYLAKVARPDFDGVCSSEIVPLRPRPGYCQGYLAYCLLNSRLVRWLDSLTYGAKMPRISPGQLSRSHVAMPSWHEQRAIATFLDRETAKIDALVARKERLTRLLQEKRRALITRAVTRGLDPNVPMKDSGVEWLGEIPAHWDLRRTKFVALLRSGHTPSRQNPEYWRDATIPWFGLADVWQLREKEVEYVHETAEKISELGLANSAARLLPKGTVILSRTASVGYSGILGVDMATTQDFVNWVCGPSLRPEYLLYVFRTMGQEFQRLTIGSTHKTIYMPDVACFSTPMPPPAEQDQIVADVRVRAASIDGLTAKIQRALDHLNEYRTALISAAVTGKIDVREEVAAG